METKEWELSYRENKLLEMTKVKNEKGFGGIVQFSESAINICDFLKDRMVEHEDVLSKALKRIKALEAKPKGE